jgi:hypothetical protein
MDSRWARVARGCTAAAFAVFVAAFSHLQVGGSAPSAFAILVSLVISGMLCTMLAGRGASLWRLIVSVGVTQFLFHWLFSGLGTPVVAAHHMGAMPMDAPAAAHHNTVAMWLAHGAAGVITIVALRYGGSAFWGVADTARLLYARLTALLVPVIPAPRPLTTVADRGFVPRDLALLLSSMRHRGPPMGIA